MENMLMNAKWKKTFLGLHDEMKKTETFECWTTKIASCVPRFISPIKCCSHFAYVAEEKLNVFVEALSN